MDFVKDVWGVADRYARKVFGTDDESYSLAMVLCWWIFTQRREDFPASCYIRLAVRNVRYGRDLPGVQASKFRDVYDYLTKWDGGDMNLVIDRRPGPERVAEMREEMEAFLATCTEQERAVAETLMGDHGATVAHLADLIGRSQGRVSQIRRELKERLDD